MCDRYSDEMQIMENLQNKFGFDSPIALKYEYTLVKKYIVPYCKMIKLK